MNRNQTIAFRVACIAGAVFFMIPYVANIQEGLKSAILNGLLGGLIWALIAYVLTLAFISEKPKFAWWQWVFYVVGWVSGALNLLFWLIMLVIHSAKEYGDPFFNKAFHKRVVVWGMVVSTLVILALVYFGVFSLATFSLQ